MKDKRSNPESLYQAKQPDDSPDELRRLAGEMPADEELKDLLAQWSTPDSYAALDHQVMTAYRQRSRPSFWRRLMTASIRVPVPVMAAAMLLILLSAAVTLRVLSHEPQLVLPSFPQAEQVKFVELPGKEKIITRIVYVERKGSSVMGRQANPPARPALSLAVYGGKEETGYFTQGDLSGFQPAEEMSFKIIKKEVKQHEK